jgi:predicted permease
VFRSDTDLDAELRDHLEQEIESGIRAGLSPDEARRSAQRLFGPVALVKEECREARGTRWLQDFLQDGRYGLRVLRKSPVFTAVAILSLALGIGAGTAIFSLMDRVMFRMLPVREPRQLVQISRFHPPYEGPSHVSYPLFQEFGKDLTSLQGLLAHHDIGVRDITIGGNTEPVHIELVSGSYYPLLGVRAAIGRVFGEEVDHAPGANPVAVISHRYWERRFASDPAVIGKSFRRLDTVFTIVGVTPTEFFGTLVGQEPDITIPLTMDAQVRGGKSWLNEPDYNWLSLLGRLKPGVGMNQATAEVKRLFASIVAADAVHADSDRDRRARLTEYVELQPGGNGFDDLRRQFAQPLVILMGTVALVLLLACANLANLLLGKAAARQREIAVRLAMGAGRGRVIRQLLTEGLLLALAGGTLGVLLAYVLDEALVSMMSNGGPRMLLDVRPDARVLLFAVALSFTACVLFSLVPAVQAVRPPARATRWRLGKGLIVTQLAVSVLLLIVAGLFGRTLMNIYALDPGFDRHDVVLFSTNARRLGYSREKIQEIQTRVPRELAALPWVQSASMSMFPPISGGGWDGTFLLPGGDGVAHINSVAADFFKTFNTPVLLGREFNQRDTADSPRVVVVNEAFARAHFVDRSPIGRWVAIRSEPNTHYEIVGVVKDAKYESLRHDFPPTVYMMAEQVPPGPDSYTFAVRTRMGTASAGRAIAETLARVDKALRPTDVVSLEEHVASSLLRERMMATLAGFFGLQAVVLSAVGIYGVMIFQVARRRREIGIRMAMGADARTVVGMVVGQTAQLTLLGGLIGAAAGLIVTRGAQGILYGVRPNDPLTFMGAVGVLLSIAIAAAYLPGLSAARTNPVDTLRVE